MASGKSSKVVLDENMLKLNTAAGIKVLEAVLSNLGQKGASMEGSLEALKQQLSQGQGQQLGVSPGQEQMVSNCSTLPGLVGKGSKSSKVNVHKTNTGTEIEEKREKETCSLTTTEDSDKELNGNLENDVGCEASRPKTGTKKVPWTTVEDSRLKSIIESNCEGKDKDGKLIISMTWGEIADLIPHRTAKQCRERWCYNLDPSINHSSWSVEEDAILLKAQSQLHNQWALIAKYLPGRTENAVKTRYKSVMRAERREWKPAEDAIIFKMMQEYGSKWDLIKKHLPGRTANAIKTRFSMLKKGTHLVPESELAGSARQVWLRPELIKTIDINKLVRKTPQRLSERNSSPLSNAGSNSLTGSLDLTNQATPAKRIRLESTISGFPSVNNSCLNLNANLASSLLEQGHRGLPIQTSNVDLIEPSLCQTAVEPSNTSTKLLRGFNDITEALLSDESLHQGDKVTLLNQSQTVLSNYIHLKKARFGMSQNISL